jgi:amino acid adenylation domain-containing protein
VSTIAELFAAQAARTPSRVAMAFDGQPVIYAALNARANQLARHLRRRGAGPARVVGVCMRHSADLVVAILALAKTGATYAGLDPGWPAARIAEALTDSAASLVLVDADDTGAVLEIGDRVPRSSVSDAADESADDLAIATPLDHLMSIVYTSGSTGKPKGVMVTVRSVVNRMAWMWTAYPFEGRDVALLYRSCATVGFTWDCFGALLQGIPTVIESAVDARNPAALVTVARDRGVTHLTASASLWDAILDEVEHRAGGWPSLRLARTTGEPLRPRLLERWRRALPQARLLNIYGATECSGSTSCDTTSHETAALRTGATRVSVGAAVPNVEVHVLNDDLMPLGPGEEGDVYIGGASLARGYLGRPSVTAERFVPNPVRAGERIFRTGDVGRWRADGQLDLVGRRDLQVKIRGFRVEIEEVEAALRQCPDVAAAAVRAEDVDGAARLVAYLVPATGLLSLREIRAALGKRVPAYMVPASFVMVDALPRTATGKINRPALDGLEGRALDLSSAAETPATPSELIVASIWQDVLGLSSVGVDDDFFELGGHSIAGIKILSRVYDTFGLDLPFNVFFDAQTVKALASQIDSALALR